MWANYHTHCDYCDGKSPMQDYVDQAKELGMMSMWLLIACAGTIRYEWCMRRSDEEYINAVNEIRKTEHSTEVNRTGSRLHTDVTSRKSQ